MKKLFFTVVALIAFNGFSFAENLTSEQLRIIKINCWKVYESSYGGAIAAGADHIQAANIALNAYNTCLIVNNP